MYRSNALVTGGCDAYHADRMHVDSHTASMPPPAAAHGRQAGGSPYRRGLPPGGSSFDARRYTTWLVGPLALVCIFTKLHKLIATPGGDVGSALAALFPDVAFIVVFALVTWLALRFTSGPLRVVARVVLHLATLVLTVLIFVEHGFWLTTGTLLDPYTLGYGLEHIGALGKVYLSEMGVRVWFGFAVLLAVHWLPTRAQRKRARIITWTTNQVGEPRASRVGAARPLVPLALLLLLPACTCVAALAVDISPPVEPLSENVVVEFASEAFAADVPAEPDTTSTSRPVDIALATGPRAIDAIQPGGPPPNVIIIVMESLRARSTTLHDPELDTTPFLASLAARGTHTDLTWTTVTHTSKAIVGALCGIYPKLDVPIDEAEPTGLPPTCLARILRERGYATAFMQSATARFERRDQLIENMHYETFLSKETIPQKDFEETSYFGWEDESLVAPAVTWAKQQQDEKRPFFMTLLTLSTHHTYGTPTTFQKKSRNAGEAEDYLNAVAYLDQTLAKLFAGLEQAGLLDRTLVVLLGDHGEGFGEHGRRQHDSVIYEEGLHIPLVMLGPGITPGSHIGGMRSAVDVVPTVLEWLGTPVVAGLPGMSLLSTDGHDQLFASCWLRQRCIATRKGDLKYIWHYDKQEPELFDLAKDPLERDNLVKSVPESTWGPMKARLIDWKDENHARWASFFAVAAREFVTTLPPLPQHELDITYSSPAVTTETGDTIEARPVMRLIGLDVPETRVTSGDPISITLHWEVLSPPGAWTPFTHLMGLTPNSRPRYNGDHTPVGGRYPTSSWIPGTFVSDEFRIQPNTNLPAGTYELVVGLWDPTSKVTGPAGRAIVNAPISQSNLLDKDQRAHLIKVEVLPEVPTGKPPGPTGGPEHTEHPD